MIETPLPQVLLLAFTDNLNLPAAAARFCTSTAGVEEVVRPRSSDPALLQRVVGMGHLSILEHVSFTFGVSGISRVTEAQFVRHRIASFSVKSGRYTKVGAAYPIVLPPTLRNHPDPALRKKVLATVEEARRLYVELLETYDIPQEDARYFLPQATATQLMVTMNARELLHFFSKRTCGRAQWEIRGVAKEMLALCRQAAPEIFREAGPSCLKEGRCYEKPELSCGLRPHHLAA